MRANRPTPVQFAWVTFCLVAMCGILLARDPFRTDFRTFYNSAVAWQTGASSLYPDVDPPNLNPPWLAPVLSPLSHLSLRNAFLAWSVLGAVLVVASLRIVYRTLMLSTSQRFWIAGAMVAAMPCAMVWGQGQITWLLLYPLTRAWAAPPSSPITAGLWLTPVIALKPQLVLLLLFLPVSITSVAAIGAGLATGVGVAVTGIEPWRQWLLQSRQVVWLGHPENGSLWAPLSRLVSGDIAGASIFDMPMALVVFVVMLALVSAVAALRETDRDRRWVLAMVWATVFSPLGWVYYLPIIIGPFLAGWPGTVAARVALGLLCVPIRVLWPLATDVGSASLVGIIYPVGVVLTFFAWLSGPRRDGRSMAQDAAKAVSTPAGTSSA